MKTKEYSLWAKATAKDGSTHYVTVSGRFSQEKVSGISPNETTVTVNGKNHTALQLVDYTATVRKFTMARAICHPNDKFDVEVGKQLAMHRIDKGETIGTVESRDVTMLNEDMCNMLLLNELQFTISNLDKFLSKKN